MCNPWKGSPELELVGNSKREVLLAVMEQLKAAKMVEKRENESRTTPEKEVSTGPLGKGIWRGWGGLEPITSPRTMGGGRAKFL